MTKARSASIVLSQSLVLRSFTFVASCSTLAFRPVGMPVSSSRAAWCAVDRPGDPGLGGPQFLEVLRPAAFRRRAGVVRHGERRRATRLLLDLLAEAADEVVLTVGDLALDGLLESTSGPGAAARMRSSAPRPHPRRRAGCRRPPSCGSSCRRAPSCVAPPRRRPERRSTAARCTRPSDPYTRRALCRPVPGCLRPGCPLWTWSPPPHSALGRSVGPTSKVAAPRHVTVAATSPSRASRSPGCARVATAGEPAPRAHVPMSGFLGGWSAWRVELIRTVHLLSGREGCARSPLAAPGPSSPWSRIAFELLRRSRTLALSATRGPALVPSGSSTLDGARHRGVFELRRSERSQSRSALSVAL